MSSFHQKLPLEIRRMIYKLVLISPTDILEVVTRGQGRTRGYPSSWFFPGPYHYLRIANPKRTCNTKSSTNPNKKEPRFLSISLLSTCRQIYQEARHISWENNTFYFTSPNALLHSFSYHGFSILGNMTSIMIGVGDKTYFDMRKFQRAMAVLKTHFSSDQQKKQKHIVLFVRFLETIEFQFIRSGSGGGGWPIYCEPPPYHEILASISELARDSSCPEVNRVWSDQGAR